MSVADKRSEYFPYFFLDWWSMFGFNPGTVFRYHAVGSDGDKRTVLDKYLRSFSDHRISPYNPAPLDGFTCQWPRESEWEGAARLTLGERPGELDLDLALRLWRGTAEIGVAQRPAGTETQWDVRGVDLQPQLLLTNPALGALRGLLSTKGAVRLDGGGAATLAGTLSLDWSGAQIAGRAVDGLSIQGAQPQAGAGTGRSVAAPGGTAPEADVIRLPEAPPGHDDHGHLSRSLAPHGAGLRRPPSTSRARRWRDGTASTRHASPPSSPTSAASRSPTSAS